MRNFFTKKLLYTLTSSLSIALGIFFVKMAYKAGAQVVPFVIQALFCGSCFLGIYLLFFQRENFRQLDSGVLKSLFLIGFFVGINYFTASYAMSLISTINYSLLSKSTLIFTVLLAYFFLGEKLSKRKIFLIILLIIGAYLVSTKGESIYFQVADLLVFITVLLKSIANIIQKKTLNKKVSPEIVGFARIFIGTLVLTIIYFLFDSKKEFKILVPHLVLLVGVINAFIVVSMNRVIQIAGAGYLEMILMSVPVFNIVLGILFLGESINSFQILGSILIIGSGVFLVFKKV